MHYASVRRVIHIDASDGFLNYVQETGRAGRDGLFVICLTLLAAKWSVSWDARFESDFLLIDCDVMIRFLECRGCLQQYLTSYLDGGFGVACDFFAVVELRFACSVCAFRFVAKDSTLFNTVPLFLAIREPITGAASSDTELDVNVNSSSMSIEVRNVVDKTFEDFDAISVFDVPFSSDDSFSNKEHSISEKSSKYELKGVYDVAALLARNKIVNREQGFDLYEQRIVR